MSGVEDVLHFVTPQHSPAFSGGEGSREGVRWQIVKWSVGVIRTANMIDFVPLPTPLPFFFSPSCPRRTLCSPRRTTLVSFQNGRTFLDPAAINLVSGLLFSI